MGIDSRLAGRMSMAEQHEYLRSKLWRRRVIRGSAAVAGASAGTGLLGSSAYAAGTAQAVPAQSPTLLTSSATAHVDGSLVVPFGRHLAFGADPQTQIRVSWQVPLAVKKPFIRVGAKPWDLKPEDRGRGASAAHRGSYFGPPGRGPVLPACRA
jgi:hypothetical protein